MADESKESRAVNGLSELCDALARMVGDVIFELDPDAVRFRWAQDAAHCVLGYEPGALALQKGDLLRLVAREERDKLDSALNDLLQGKQIKVDLSLLGPDGEYHGVQLVGGPVETRSGETPRIAGILRNTHALHRALVSLYEARRMETVGTMARGIAHEFNNHLTPIRGYLELAKEQVREDADLVAGLNAALDRVRYCSDLVAQIQAYGRTSVLKPEAVEVDRLIPSILRLAISSFPQVAERIAVKEAWPEDLPPLWVDQGQFQQAMLHLFRNAIEAMPDGGTLSVHAEPVGMNGDGASQEGGREEDDGFVCIRVSDTGKGIRPEHRARIFEPFFTTNDRMAARGMGLPMVQGMVAQHGGWTEIKSDVGQGTTVAIFLPVAKKTDPETGPAPDADGTLPVASAAWPGRMLVADDEPFIRRLIRKVFATEGWHVDEAPDNDDVVRRVHEKPDAYGLIVLDLTMPGASTEETIHEIVRTNPRARILFISGYARDERIDRLIAMTKSDFISKPFSPNDLLTRVDALIR